MARKLSHNGLVELRIKGADRRTIFAGLLWIARKKDYSYGWVAHKFREIFGGWPRPQSRVEPAPPSSELMEWIGIINGRYRAKKKREEERVAELKADGLMPSFMQPEDWDVRL